MTPKQAEQWRRLTPRLRALLLSHRPDEFVPLAEYHAAIEGLIELLVRWCGILE